VGSDPSEYPETALARLNLYEFPFCEVSPSISQETTSGEATDSPKADSGRSASQANLSVLYCPFSDTTPI
jgi:hypothetical protein